MLRELRIQNYAVIEDLALDLGPGLNVLTGETGSGKSVIVGALSLLLGERASSDVVRADEAKAVVEGVFDVTDVPSVAEACRQAGLEADDGWLILRREVHREGRNRAWVNGSPATASLVREIGSTLVDLHGQYEHQALLRREAQRAMLDAFAGSSELADEVGAGFASLQGLQAELQGTLRAAAELRQREEYLRFTAEEIEAAHLRPGEDEGLRAEARRLEHSEELLTHSGTLYAAVYGEEDSLVERLGALDRHLEALSDIDPGLRDLRQLYDSARAELEELGRRLGTYHHSVEHDPERLAGLRERLDIIGRLVRKHATTIEDVLAIGAAARNELHSLDRSGAEIRRLERKLEDVRRRLEERAAALGQRRTEAAARLKEEVSRLFPDLGMPAGTFRVALEPLPETGPHGSERVEFRVALNPGFEPGPLSRVASGGELSRVMLALKTVLAGVDRIPCLVFDEIDAGVGGRVAHRVAERLVDVASRHQVLAVTHLPQIASRATSHLRVEKTEAAGTSATRVRLLSGEERVEEVARMLGGDPEREASRRHAVELLSEQADRNSEAGRHDL